jgi:hypothetical protein
MVFFTRIALGMGFWIYFLFLLSTVGFLYRTVVYASTAAVSMVGFILFIINRLKQPKQKRRHLLGGKRVTLSKGLLITTLAFVLVVLFFHTISPIISWDANAYHLTIPRLYLENHGFRRIPFNVYSNWPLNIELLFCLSMVMKDYILAKLVHFLFGLLLIAAIYRFIRSATSPAAGLIASVLFLCNPVILFEIKTAYIDIAYAFFFFIAFVFVHRALEDEKKTNFFIFLAGICCGILAGIKLTGIFGVLCLAILFVYVRFRKGTRMRSLLKPLLLLVSPSIILLVPWIIKSILLTGNPVYPFLHSLFGGPEWNSALHAMFSDWQKNIGMGRSLLDYLLLPFRVILLGGGGSDYTHFGGQINQFWIILIPLSVIIAWRNGMVRRCLGISLIYFVIWSLTSQQMRFLISIVPFLSAAAAISIFELLSWIKNSRMKSILRMFASVSLSLILLLVNITYIKQGGPMLNRYLRMGSDIKAAAIHPVYHFINNHLPAHARIMMLNTNQGFFCNREYIADSFFEASQINAFLKDQKTRQGIYKRLKELRISHILLGNWNMEIQYPTALFEFLNDSSLSRIIYRSPDGYFLLYKVINNN